jgi:hypothetical protein
LDHILRGHLNLPKGLKETHFFNLRYDHGIDWYLNFFKNQRSGVVTGEFSPSYFTSREARERIATHLPGCRIVCTLREPVERLYSSYRSWRKLALVRDTFERVADRHRDLLAFSSYSEQLSAWQRVCGRENVLVMIHEDCLSDRQSYMDRLCDFIGAERLDLGNIHDLEKPVNQVEFQPKSITLARRARQLRGFLALHKMLRTRDLLTPAFEFCMGRGARFPALDPHLAMRLRKRFEPEISSLEKLLGRDLDVWRSRSCDHGASLIERQHVS